MRASTWMVTLAAAGLGLVSCSELTLPNSKDEAQGRWNMMRSRLKYQLAAGSFDKGQLDEAQEFLSEAIGLNPEDADGYVLMTRILLERGETASATETLAEATRCGGETAETHYLNGLIAQRYARFTEALSRYQRASELEPTNAHYVATVAETLVALDRVADALALVEDRCIDFEQNATLRSVAGGIYAMLGRYKAAADAYRAAALIAPDDQTLQFQLGVSLALSGDYKEGRTVLSAVAATAEEDIPGSVLTALGRCHLGLGEYDQAKVVARRVVDADPDNVRAWSLLGQAALASGDLLTARRAATRAVQIEPASRDHAMLLAYVCWRQQDYVPAVTSLEGLLHDAPDDLIALYLLGRCHEATGNPRAAEDCYHRALRVNPRCQWARELLENGSASIGPAATAGRWSMTGGSARSP